MIGRRRGSEPVNLAQPAQAAAVGVNALAGALPAPPRTRRRGKSSTDAGDRVAGALQWSSSSALVTRALTVLVLVALVTGPVALVVDLAKGAPSAVRAAVAVPAVDPGEVAAVGEFAGEYVTAWLGATSSSSSALARFTGARNISVALPVSGLQATDPQVAALRRGPVAGQWAVTVAVTVIGAPVPAGQGAQSDTAATDSAAATAPDDVVRYYATSVSYQSGAVVALTLPAPVAAPAGGQALDLGYGSQVPLVSPLASTVQEFLAALLTGSSDAGRLESPGTTITAVSPAPYAGVQLAAVSATTPQAAAATVPATGARARVLASATAQIDSTHQQAVQYALTLTARAGRWEITSLDPTPVLSDATGSGS